MITGSSLHGLIHAFSSLPFLPRGELQVRREWLIPWHRRSVFMLAAIALIFFEIRTSVIEARLHAKFFLPSLSSPARAPPSVGASRYRGGRLENAGKGSLRREPRSSIKFPAHGGGQ
jgi:hypothetical protein